MLTPKLPSFIKLPRYKRFEYKPLYYNEAKEEMKNRYERIKDELNLSDPDKPGYKSDAFRERLKSRWNRNTYSKSVSTSNFRVFLILIVIVALIWYFFR
jgi:hypothetical protein